MKKELLIFLIVIGVSVFYRTVHLSDPKLFGNDPYFHLAVIKDAVSKGFIDFTPNWSYYPEERPLFEPAGLYAPTIIVAKTFQPLGLNIVHAIKTVPVIFGITGLAFLYLLVREVFNDKTAALTVFALSVSVAHVYRSMAGHYRGDNFFLTLTIISFYAFVKAHKNNDWKQKILLFTASGVIGGLNYFFWNGYPLYLVLVTTSLVAGVVSAFIKGELGKKKLVGFMTPVIALIIVLAARELSKTYRYAPQLFFEPLFATQIMPSTLALCLLLFFSQKKLGSWKKRLLTIFLLCVVTATLVLALKPGLINDLSSRYFFTNQHQGFYGTVSELTPPEPGFLWVGFTYYLILTPLGVGIMLYELDFKKGFLLGALLVSAFLLFSAKRYSFVTSPFLLIPAAVFVNQAHQQISKTRWRNYATHLIVTALIPSLLLGFYYTSHLGYRSSNDWLQAFEWMSDNLEEGPVLVWWDMGSWEEGVLGWPSYVDSVHGQSPGRIKDLATFFLTNGSMPEWSDNASYLILSRDLVSVWGNVESAANTSLDSTIINAQYLGTGEEQGFTVHDFTGKGYTIRVVQKEGQVFSVILPDIQLSHTFVKENNSVTSYELGKDVAPKKLDASFYWDKDYGHGVLFMNDLLESNYVQNMYFESKKGLEPVYYNGVVKVFSARPTT